ncbi:MAG: hypothetical protein ACOY3K_00510 [Candidatus Omnitrophota bacterium]
MLLVVKLIGILMTVFGVCLILKPEWIRRIAEYVKEGKRIYGAGVVRIVCGTLLFLGAGACRWPKFVVLIGILFVLSGAVIFFIKPERQQALFQWWLDRPMEVLRYMAIVPLSLGVLVLLAA